MKHTREVVDIICDLCGYSETEIKTSNVRWTQKTMQGGGRLDLCPACTEMVKERREQQDKIRRMEKKL